MTGCLATRAKEWVSSPPGWARLPISVLWPLWLRARKQFGGRSVPESFYCRALAGLSDYNICINSDMTVSCNCQDYSGQGHIGNLREQSLAGILASQRVQEFQQMLRRGEYPTDVCSRCVELAVCPARTALEDIFPGQVPHRGLMVENTARCNLRCDMCDRQGILAQRSRASLSLPDIAEIAQILREHSVERVYYHNLGEPFLSPTVLQELRLVRSINPEIEIWASTNGLLIDNDDKREAALLMDNIAWSLDGVDQATAERYQRGTDFERSLRNLTTLIGARAERGRVRDDAKLPVIEWKYVLFRWNNRPQHIREALSLAKEAGVDFITFNPGFAPVGSRSRRHYYDAALRDGEWRSDGSVVFWLNERARDC